ncbi:MAG: hypothetical protein SPL30_01315 [Succinivibrio sp.]|nr:hypothetical protein [Succinivibrio sp.]
MSVSAVISSLLPKSLKVSAFFSQVKVAHFNEGRVRVIYDALRHDDDLYRSVCGALDGIAEITSWKISRITGSVTINYDPARIEAGSFLEQLIDGARARA